MQIIREPGIRGNSRTSHTVANEATDYPYEHAGDRIIENNRVAWLRWKTFCYYV